MRKPLCSLLLLLAGCFVYEGYPVYRTRIIEEPYPTCSVRYKEETPPPSPPQTTETVIVVKEEPRLVRIEETHIWWAPYPRYDIYFVDGVWYCYYAGSWFYGYSWRGPWRRIYCLPDVFWYVPASHPRYGVIVRCLPPRRVERGTAPRRPSTRRTYTPPRTIRATPPPRPSHPARTTPRRITRSSTSTPLRRAATTQFQAPITKQTTRKSKQRAQRRSSGRKKKESTTSDRTRDDSKRKENRPRLTR